MDNLNKLAILLVDDNPDDRLLVVREIAKVLPGARVDEVGEPAGLERLLASGTHWDVVVTDYQLQWSTGLELFRRLQRERPNVPVIMFTDSGSEEVAVAALQEGMADYITKSIRHYGRVPYAAQAAAERWARRSAGIEAARARERSEALLKLAVEAAGMDTWEMDRTAGELHLHGRSPAIFGGVPRTLALEALRKLFHENDAAELRQRFEQSVAEGGRFEAEFRVHIGDRDRWLRVAGVPDHATRVVGVVEDVTGRRQLLEQLREADKRKDQFIATLAHELRNPLAPIGYASQLLHRSTDPGVTRAAEVIDRQVRAMSALLDQLLDVSRITHGQVELQREPLDLRELVREALDDIRPWAQENSRALRLEVPATQVPVWGDSTRLRQVLQNLLNNAMKYTAAGGSISITLQTQDHQACVAVSDDGVGIRPGMLEQVFESLVQLHAGPEAPLRGGLGIGLAVVRSIVTLHGGSVTARSPGEGQGATFEFVLPLWDGKAAGPLDAPAVKAEASAPAAARPRRILVADDHPDAAKALAEVLQAEGHEVRSALNGQGARDLAALWRPDVMVLDVGMPDLTGDALARWVRSQPWGATVRLVAVTGWGRPSERELLLAAGFDVHLVKPVEPAALLSALA